TSRLASLNRSLMWTIGSLLLIVFNVLEWLVTFPLRRRSKWVFRVFLVFVLFLVWMVPTGDRRFDTPAAAAALEHGYGLVSWELDNFFDKWGHRVWTALPWTPTSESDRRAALDRYVLLVEELRTAKAELTRETSNAAPDSAKVEASQQAVDRLLDERDEIRASVEEYLEQIIGDAVRSAEIDLVSSFVWPPVDFRIGDPPKLLVTSARDHIVRLEDVLIDPDIAVEDMSRIENELSGDHDISAVVLQTGGLASYPNVVPTTHLKRLVDVASHEWLHAYLAFHPLGRAYFGGGDIRSMNETLADIFGREVGLRVYSEVTGEPFVAPIRPETASKTEDEVDTTDADEPEVFSFNRFMSETRTTTDELLADGNIEEAEAYMESRRVELLDHNYNIRKINQAYFAFHGTYAESPSSTSPIARYMWDLREQVGSVGELVKLLRPLGTYEQFEQLLVERGIELEESE
ncbi:hypothetical protein JYU04_04280, partial [Dehalococcoides mccartyi]|nr:hypothetical protein [Dehalococcoides mccartyi]